MDIPILSVHEIEDNINYAKQLYQEHCNGLKLPSFIWLISMNMSFCFWLEKCIAMSEFHTHIF